MSSNSCFPYPPSPDFFRYLTTREFNALQCISKVGNTLFTNLLLATVAIRRIESLKIISPNYLSRNGLLKEKPGTSAFNKKYDALGALLTRMRDSYFASLPPDPLSAIKGWAQLARQYKRGNCGELAYLAFDILSSFTQEKIALRVVQVRRKTVDVSPSIEIYPYNEDDQIAQDHTFILIGNTNETAVVCDPWSQHAYPDKVSTFCLSNYLGLDKQKQPVLSKFNPLKDDLIVLYK